jgi:putative sigma-54 modulation protein
VQVNVSARHGSISSHDQQVIREKAEKLQRFFDRINAVLVTVDFQHQDHPHVEINITAEHAPEFVASSSSTTVISALDATIQKIEQQLRKHKEKLSDHKAVGVKHIPPVDSEQD